LTNAAAFSQASKQVADQARELFGLIFRTLTERSADLEINVIDAKRAMAPDTSAILRELASIAAPAGNGFAITNRGEELKSRHCFPLNVFELELSE
jgi:hypothetical protein